MTGAAAHLAHARTHRSRRAVSHPLARRARHGASVEKKQLYFLLMDRDESSLYAVVAHPERAGHSQFRFGLEMLPAPTQRAVEAGGGRALPEYCLASGARAGALFFPQSQLRTHLALRCDEYFWFNFFSWPACSAARRGRCAPRARRAS